MRVFRFDPPQYFARVRRCFDGEWTFIAGLCGNGWQSVETRDTGFVATRDEAWRLARLALSRLVNEQHARTS